MSKRTEIPTNYLDPEEATGLPVLPVSRVKKVIKADEDIYQCTKQATVLATIATEMFVQYLAEQGVKALVAEKKPRKTMQYKDVASAVARIDNLEFLSDVIPQRLAVKEPRETKPAKSRVKGGAVDKRQTTLTAGLTKPTSAADKDAVDGVQENGESSREASADPLEDSGSKKRDAAPSNGSPKSHGTESKTAADNSDPDVEMT